MFSSPLRCHDNRRIEFRYRLKHYVRMDYYFSWICRLVQGVFSATQRELWYGLPWDDTKDTNAPWDFTESMLTSFPPWLKSVIYIKILELWNVSIILAFPLMCACVCACARARARPCVCVFAQIRTVAWQKWLNRHHSSLVVFRMSWISQTPWSGLNNVWSTGSARLWQFDVMQPWGFLFEINLTVDICCGARSTQLLVSVTNSGVV